MNLIALLIPVVAMLQPTASPKVEARLYATQDSIKPGGQTEVAVELNVEEGWHLYHPVILETGAPVSISFDAPPGVGIGELRFPSPVFGEDQGLKCLTLEGRFVVVLTTMQIAAEVEPGPLAIKAHISALAYKQLCVPVTAEATLVVKVATSTPAPANQKLFEDAREALPKPLLKSPYIEGSQVTVSKEKLGLDEQAEIVLTVRVRKGHHILDRDPGTPDLIASRLFVEKINGVRLDDQLWPDPHVRDSEVFGKVREQNGEFKIRAPFALIDEKFLSGPVALRVLFSYQCCTDAGVCYPPLTAEGVIRFVAATPNAPPTDVATLSPMLPDVTVMDRAQLLPAVAAAAAGFRLTTLLWNLVLGFLGGLIFNITPCVFPVISIKIIGFIKQAGEDRGRVLKLGLTFCAGIMVWFWIFGILTGLGQVPMQHPPVVIGLTAVLFILALNLFGVFEIVLPGAASQKLAEATSREGYSGTFMKGLLATLLGTACTAPLFAGAAAYATTQPRVVAFLIFTAAGLGMSSPYVLLSAFPGWLKRIPKPGPWMVTFKQAMGFVLMATTVWLLLIVGDLLDASGVVWTVAFLGFLGAGAWLIGKIQFNWERGARLVTWLAAIAIAAFGGWFSFVKMYDLRAAMQPKDPNAEVAAVNTADVGALAAATADAVAKADWTGHIPWQPWRAGLPEELSRRGFTVYVDFTATWCFTCQTNKATSLDIDSARAKMRDAGVIPLKGDYTKQDPSIRKQLLAFGVNSVPLNLVYPAGRPEAIVHLPVILTPGIVSDALDKAGPSNKKPQDSPAP